MFFLGHYIVFRSSKLTDFSHGKADLGSKDRDHFCIGTLPKFSVIIGVSLLVSDAFGCFWLYLKVNYGQLRITKVQSQPF